MIGGGLACLVCLCAIIRWPAFAAYLLLFTTPLIVGISRGPIPLRPNETVLLIVLMALTARVLLLMLSQRCRCQRVAVHPIVPSHARIHACICAGRGHWLRKIQVLSSCLRRWYTLCNHLCIFLVLSSRLFWSSRLGDLRLLLFGIQFRNHHFWWR